LTKAGGAGTPKGHPPKRDQIGWLSVRGYARTSAQPSRATKTRSPATAKSLSRIALSVRSTRPVSDETA
jgi:hypothetical protein